MLLADIASTGFSGAESGGVRIGDAVVVFAQGPIGLCATAGARLMGASLVIGVDGDAGRLAMAQRMGADVVLDYRSVDVVAEVRRLTGGGADVAIEALGTQETFENAPALPAARRHAVEPRRLLGQARRCPTTPSPRASATTGSSRRSARAARSACAG